MVRSSNVPASTLCPILRPHLPETVPISAQFIANFRAKVRKIIARMPLHVSVDTTTEAYDDLTSIPLAEDEKYAFRRMSLTLISKEFSWRSCTSKLVLANGDELRG